MYDRSNRNFKHQKNTATSEYLGPGAYNHFSTIGQHNEGYAPFQSLAGREFALHNETMAAVVPGPGQYDISTQNETATNLCSSLKNKSARFDKSHTDVPGPGRYSIQSFNAVNSTTNFGIAFAAGTSSSAPGNAAHRHEKKVHLRRKPIASSIPDPRYAYGYEEGPDGSLVKQEPPKRDTSLGPAYYTPLDVHCNSSNNGTKYAGCSWSKQRSDRIKFHEAKNSGPGPGAYDPWQENWAATAEAAGDSGTVMTRNSIEGIQTNTNNVGGQSSIPRFIEQVENQAKKHPVPGPGAYNSKGLFDKKQVVINGEIVEIDHPPFGSQAKRFFERSSSLPGPGSYNDPRNALTSLKKVTGMKKSPFGQTSVRFMQNENVKLPGPASYTVGGGIDATKIAPSYIAFTRRGGFGSTMNRQAGMQAAQAASQDCVKGTVAGRREQFPGPNHYQPAVTGGANGVGGDAAGQRAKYAAGTQPLSSMFASLTNRDFDPTLNGSDIPPPGHYNVDESFKVSQDKHTRANPRNKEAMMRNQCFMSATDRNVKNAPGENWREKIPGPGTYNLTSKNKPAGSLIANRTERFTNKIELTPGPAHYELSPEVMNTVNQKTFNATLLNPVSSNKDLAGLSTTGTVMGGLGIGGATDDMKFSVMDQMNSAKKTIVVAE